MRGAAEPPLPKKERLNYLVTRGRNATDCSYAGSIGLVGSGTPPVGSLTAVRSTIYKNAVVVAIFDKSGAAADRGSNLVLLCGP